MIPRTRLRCRVEPTSAITRCSRLSVVDNTGTAVSIEPNSGVWQIRISYKEVSGEWKAKADLYDPDGKPQNLSFTTTKGDFPGLSTHGVFDDLWNKRTWMYAYKHNLRTDIQIRGLEK